MERGTGNEGEEEGAEVLCSERYSDLESSWVSSTSASS